MAIPPRTTAKIERLLLTILPRQVIGRLNHGETMIADRFEDVSVLFADLVRFTEHSGRIAPAVLVEYLNQLFSEFDALARELGVEKINRIHVSQDSARHLVGSFALEPRGSIDVKGKGKLETFFLSRI